jgi:hypothetical protein
LRSFQYGQITVSLDSADLIENRQQLVSAWTYFVVLDSRGRPTKAHFLFIFNAL